MKTILDIDLDFFVSPIYHGTSTDNRIPNSDATVDSIEVALEYLEAHCGLPKNQTLPGAYFENHDELFDAIVTHIDEPIHLIHVDAHADIGGGFTKCWQYMFCEYAHLAKAGRRYPKRGANFLNCGNVVAFLAFAGLVEKVTFVSHQDWTDDYQPLYMEHFDPNSSALQLKRFSAKAIENAGFLTPLYQIEHELEPSIPLIRVGRENFYIENPPDALFVTRSPGYTPESADILYDVLIGHIEPF